MNDELVQKWREEFRAILDCKNAFMEMELSHSIRKEPER